MRRVSRAKQHHDECDDEEAAEGRAHKQQKPRKSVDLLSGRAKLCNALNGSPLNSLDSGQGDPVEDREGSEEGEEDDKDVRECEAGGVQPGDHEDRIKRRSPPDEGPQLVETLMKLEDGLVDRRVAPLASSREASDPG